MTINSNLSKLTDKKLWLAPLAGYTDNAFRTICKECGADVVVSEMVSADGLIYNQEKSLEYARFKEDQRPFGIQLFGSEPKIMKQAAKILLPLNPDFIDINMGCPVKKVVKRGAGSALMKNPRIAELIVKDLKEILADTGIYLSVKIRSGWDKFSINAVEFGKLMEQAGVDLICLHPRLRSQMFSGSSDWELIGNLKQALNIPVVGNGDINDIASAVEMFKSTGCDSIMIGRGILGKPWLFDQIKSCLNVGKKIAPTSDEKLVIIQRHFELALKEKGQKKAVTEIRSHLAYYTKGWRDGAKVRDHINRCLEIEDIFEAVKSLYEGNFRYE